MSLEKTQGGFPFEKLTLVEDTEHYPADTLPDPNEGEILHYHSAVDASDSPGHFIAQRKIGDYTFIFQLKYDAQLGHEFSLETKEFKYAFINFDDPALSDQIFRSCASFIESISHNPLVNRIWSSPALTRHNVREEQDCIREILHDSGNKLTEGELLGLFSRGKSASVFAHYQMLKGEPFKLSRTSGQSAKARLRLLRLMARKYLKHWRVTEDADEEIIYIDRILK